MRNYLKHLIPTMIIIAFFYSCNDDEKNEITPEISNVSAVNHDGDGTTVPLGGNISVNFDAKARSGARMDYYHIEIHDHPKSGLVKDEYKIIDSTFKDQPTFKGLIDPHVHAHITVPDTANLGPYHVVVVVVDEAGNSSNTEEMDLHIEVVK